MNAQMLKMKQTVAHGAKQSEENWRGSKEQQRNAAAHEMIGRKDLQKCCACAHFSMKQVCPDNKKC